MPPPDDLDALIQKLRKRGFNQIDVLFHDCGKCKEHAVAIYGISGRSGGRDIQICHACGDAQSWRAAAGLEKRTKDDAFDLREFLK